MDTLGIAILISFATLVIGLVVGVVCLIFHFYKFIKLLLNKPLA